MTMKTHNRQKNSKMWIIAALYASQAARIEHDWKGFRAE
jgi:hypothetical protein